MFALEKFYLLARAAWRSSWGKCNANGSSSSNPSNSQWISSCLQIQLTFFSLFLSLRSRSLHSNPITMACRLFNANVMQSPWIADECNEHGKEREREREWMTVVRASLREVIDNGTTIEEEKKKERSESQTATLLRKIRHKRWKCTIHVIKKIIPCGVVGLFRPQKVSENYMFQQSTLQHF